MQVYEIEPTVLRGLQTEIVCPRDQQPGSAYVDALSGTDQVGLAEFMLSYTWGYKARLHTVFSSVSTPDRSLVDDIQVSDIVDSLVLMCQERNLNPKRTYVKTNARRSKRSTCMAAGLDLLSLHEPTSGQTEAGRWGDSPILRVPEGE